MLDTTVAAAPAVPPSDRRRPLAVLPAFAWLGLAAAVIALALLQVARGGVWGLDFAFDEMWRVDFLRSDSIRGEMLTHSTPVPYGWLVLMRVVTAPLPYRPLYWHAATAASMAAGLLVLGVVLTRIGRPERRLHPLVCAAAAAGLIFLSPVRYYTTYFNNYGFEVLYAALLLLAAVELPRRRAALPVLCALLVLAPMFTIGPLLMVPALAVHALRWAWRSEGNRRRRLAAVLASLVLAAGDLALVELAFYRPMSRGGESLKQYWISQHSSLGGTDSLGAILHSFGQQLRDGVVGAKALHAGGAVLALATVAAGAAAVVGVVALARRSPLLLAVAVSAQLLTIPVSAVTAWPINLQRTNLPFQVLLLLLVTLGAAQAVVVAARHLHLPAVAALPVLALLLYGLWFPTPPAKPGTFAALYRDLDVVAASPSARNLVVEYHFMARYTAHDRLINTRTPGKTFDLVSRQDATDRTLYAPLDRFVDQARLQPGDSVWCVLPNQIGPANAAAACAFSTDRVQLVRQVRGRASTIRQLVVR